MVEQRVGLLLNGAGKVNFDFCMFEMKSADEREVRQAWKRKSIIRNLQALLAELTGTRAMEDTHTSQCGVGRPRHARFTTTNSAKPCARPS